MWFDKLLDRKAPGLRGLLLVVVLALMGAVLVVQGRNTGVPASGLPNAPVCCSRRQTPCKHRPPVAPCWGPCL